MGTTVRNIGGLRLDAAEHTITVCSGTSDDGETFTVTWCIFRLADGELTAVGTSSGTAQQDNELFELFAAASTLDVSSL